MAKKINVEQHSGALTISYRWLSPAAYFLTFFALLWNAAILFFLLVGAGWFIIIHLLVGVFIGWWVLTMWLNKTVIEVDRQRMAVRHGPLPWFNSKDQEFGASKLRQLAVKRTGMRVNNQDTYHLVAIFDTGAEVKLLKHQSDLNLVQNLEQTIENFLGITDDPGQSEIEANRGLDLEKMAEHLEKLQTVKKWMPKSIRQGMEATIKQAYAEKGLQTREQRRADQHAAPTTASTNPRRTRDLAPPTPPAEDIFTGAPPEYLERDGEPYARKTGETIQLRGLAYTVASRTELTFDDPNHAGAAELELRGRETTFLYAEADGNHWRYLEQRRLEDRELSALGFTYGGVNPHRMENGEDRFYPSDKQTGNRRTPRGSDERVEQWTYVSTTDNHIFRALRVAGERWEVYVMELVPTDFVG